MANDADILSQIHELVAEERELRARHEAGGLTNTEEQRRIKHLEVQLDQAWDLLRQRRAAVDSGTDPADATTRPAEEVEGYLG